jgi:hypothetical protein
MENKIQYFPVEQVVYVPSTSQQDKQITPIAMTKRVAEVKRFLSQKYGGFTAIKSEGGYESLKDKLIQEKITKVTSFTTKKKFQRFKPALISQLKQWGKKWGQESMGLEIEGDLSYVYTPTKHKIVPLTVKQMTAHNSPSWIERQIKPWK